MDKKADFVRIFHTLLMYLIFLFRRHIKNAELYEYTQDEILPTFEILNERRKLLETSGYLLATENEDRSYARIYGKQIEAKDFRLARFGG